VTGGWHVAVDRGGTFTDLVATAPDGNRHVRKVLATGSGPQAALDLVEELDPGALIDSLRVGTTVATNALLTGDGSRTALLVTRGFADVLRIGHQARRGIFEVFPAKTRLPPLHCAVLEVNERIRVDGVVDRVLQEDELLAGLKGLREQGIESIAVALVHGYLHPDHEQQIARLASPLGFQHITLSHQMLSRPGLVDRAATSVADAFLGLVVSSYLDAVQARIPTATSLRFMKSSGGLCSPSGLRAVDAVLSGPAGGVVACAAIAEDLSLSAVLGLDMGGTSTDVCRWAGTLERSQHIEIQGRTLHAPGLDVVTVAAGGGSLLSVCDGRLQVGPGSAGARPGPACYGLGGAATVTDANLVLGRIQADCFPRSFGAKGCSSLDEEAASEALQRCSASSSLATSAAGYLAIANQRMAGAIAEISTARGHDPRGHVLIAFGGAAGQHACAVARQLGIQHVVVHPMAGVLSAHGISRASLRSTRSLPVMKIWCAELALRFSGRTAELAMSARQELVRAGAEEGRLRERLRWSLRYCGSDTELLCQDESDFRDQHERLFGITRENHPIEALWLQIEVWEEPVAIASDTVTATPRSLRIADAIAVREVGFVDPHGGLCQLQTPVFSASQLEPGDVVDGPALLSSTTTTVVVDPGWSLSVGAGAELHLRDRRGAEAATDQPLEQQHRSDDPIRLELSHRRFQSIVTRMGEHLRRLAWSTNIKERLDFSCALFDRAGSLISNAPHIPVHLGAMGATVRHLLEREDVELKAGQSWAVNDPAAGGSHLPDITVITPVFFGASQPLAFVACRAHHADIGGTTPGSMPPFSRSLAEEGVVLDGVLLFEDGRWQEERILERLSQGLHPARRPNDCIVDLKAQVSANQLGLELLHAWASRSGLGGLQEDMAAIQDNGAAAVQSWLAQLPTEERRFKGSLDDGSLICVQVSVLDTPGEHGRRLQVDFEGTGPAVDGNLNAPPAVVRAAVLYVVRVLINREIPLGDGCLRDVDIRVPKGSLLDPPRGAAVVGGNVETSQRVVDVLLAALGVCAASQGTMNNLCFGGDDLAYYETIGGGSGAGAGQSGDDAVHSHMTNTRITDVEVLEKNFPVLLREFSVRAGSGGVGRWSGGEGVRRVFEFAAPLQVSLLAQRRTTAPFGLAGGGPGASGRTLLRRSGTEHDEQLSGSFEQTLQEGDILTLETPGAGGYGAP
jgi:5-oxoprolinase (ATP-hydrolysing)